MEEYLNVEEVSEVLGLGRTTVYKLYENDKVRKFLNEELIIQKNPLRFNAEQINRLKDFFSNTEKKTRVLSVINLKGGVAKTTTVLNISVILAQKGYKTLVIDLDTQCNTTDVLSATDGTPKDFGDKTIYGCIRKLFTFPQVIYETRFDGLSLLPGDIGLGEVDVMQSIPADYFAKVIKELPYYDFIIYDTPPYAGIFSKIALYSSTDVLIPIEASNFSIKGMHVIRQLISLVKEQKPDLNELGAFVTKYEARTQISEIITEGIKKLFNSLNTNIPKRTEVEKAYVEYQPIMEYNPQNDVSEAYKTLVKEALDV